MNWLTPLCLEIMQLKSFSREHRDTVILWASELSGICDIAVPKAPVPLVDSIDQYEMLLRWSHEHDERELTVYVPPEGATSLHLRHWAHTHVTSRPTHDQLKTAVRSFFDGRVSHG